jgi:fatty-acid desaturase
MLKILLDIASTKYLDMLSSTPTSVSVIQYSTFILSVLGLFLFDFSIYHCLLILIGYFLYSGIGISMTMHRYLTHQSFEFKNSFVKWICIWFALMAGRGSMIGWVYVHRLHHAFSDTEKDPHKKNFNLWGMIFPDYSDLNKNINLKLVRDLLKKNYINIDKYYNLLIIGWIIFLSSIDIDLLYFGWVIPVALTHIVLNSFVYAGHLIGYKNTNKLHRDNSKNLWIYGILFWGEGWHDNHHQNPRNYSMQKKWWEIDLISYVIKMIKKRDVVTD